MSTTQTRVYLARLAGTGVFRDYLRGEIRDSLEEFKEIRQTKTKGDSETS